MEKFNSPENISMKASLRDATDEDQRFLFNVVRKAMRPVYEASGDVINDDETAFEEFQKKYSSDGLQVIQYGGEDVGRVRIERTSDQIFVHGIHLLPEYQGLGIGTEILKDLISESRQSKIPIRLEVRDVNTKAKELYERLGFKTKETSAHDGHTYYVMEHLAIN